MKIALASDHAGYEKKQVIVDFLKEQGIEFKDFGAYSAESSDYPDYAHPMAKLLKTATLNWVFPYVEVETGLA